MSKDTVVFEGINEQQMTNREILETIYNALQERNYNAIDQMVGYLTSGDPSYITSHNNARHLILKVDRDDLLEEILTSYLELRRSNLKLGLDVEIRPPSALPSDELDITAQGVTTIDRVGIRKDAGKVMDYVREYDCDTVVMGLPIDLDGSDSVQTEKVREFRTMLENKMRSSGMADVKVEWQDERFTTVIAERVLMEANK